MQKEAAIPANTPCHIKQTDKWLFTLQLGKGITASFLLKKITFSRTSHTCEPITAQQAYNAAGIVRYPKIENS